jgi:hypothetical protein
LLDVASVRTAYFFGISLMRRFTVSMPDFNYIRVAVKTCETIMDRTLERRNIHIRNLRTSTALPVASLTIRQIRFFRIGPLPK